MRNMNCLVNHKGMPCSCDFSDNPNPFDMESELTRLREERDRYRKALERIIRGWKDPYNCQECGGTEIAKQALSGSEVYGVPVKVDPNLKQGEWKIDKK